jgi:hypothetical protein
MGYDMEIVDSQSLEPVEGVEDPGYFRLNIWGMQRFRDYMDKLGMFSDRGIELHTLCSNDGWWVRDTWIQNSLKWYDAWQNPVKEASIFPDDVEYWNKWIQYLRRAADHGGFKVW